MQKRTLLIYLLFFQSLVAFAQTFDAGKIGVKWNLIGNNQTNPASFIAEFVIINHGNTSFPIKENALYLSYPRKVSEVLSKNASFENLSGDFCRIIFGDNVSDLAPKDSLKILYRANGKSMNKTDVPAGLYWYNLKANTTVAVNNYQVNYLPIAEKAKLKLSPEQVFKKNEEISFIPNNELLPILPSPVSYTKRNGVFKLSGQSTLSYDNDFKSEAELFNNELEQLLGKKLKIGSSSLAISLKKVNDLETEAYEVKVTENQVQLLASTPTGIFYAIQSLKMMMPANSWAKKQTSILIPCAQVKDQPRFGYRSFMLDVARNFQTKNQIFKILDLLAFYKLNTFHFHLTDDEGWRLEIPGLPELTDVGAKRGHDLKSENQLHPSYASANKNNLPGTGFYTKADFIEILKYAKARHIKVIPEIETPGHARAAVKSMDARYVKFAKQGKLEEARRYLLSDTLDQSIYTSVQGYHDNVVNVALPSTYLFINKVVDELKAMYEEAGATLNTVHLGGDEVPKGVWEKSPAIEKLMEDLNMTEYNDLWYYYLSKVNQILKSKNLYLSGWEEVAMRKTKLDDQAIYIPNPDFVNENFHTYVWNNVWGWGQEDLAYRLANAGYKVILAPVTNFYFDLAYEKDADEPGLYWGSFLDVDKPFYYNPYDHYKTAKEDPLGNPLDTSIFRNKQRLTDFGKSNIVGMQCQIWSEKIRGSKQLEYMLLPKLLGYAERAWAKTPDWIIEEDTVKANNLYNKDWNSFVNRLGQRDLQRLNYFAGGFNYRIPSAGAKIVDGKVLANVQLPGFIIKYTSNGKEPDINSKTYQGPISEKGLIKLKVFNQRNHSGRSTEVLNK